MIPVPSEEELAREAHYDVRPSVGGDRINCLSSRQYRLPIVGESHYQAAIAEVAGGWCEEGYELPVWAYILPEPDNPYDANAMRVEIAGRTVGYLSRENASALRGVIAREGWAGRALHVRALIVGGWDRGAGDRGSFGVRLDL